MHDPPPGINAGPLDDDIFDWSAVITGPVGVLHAVLLPTAAPNGATNAHIILPDAYTHSCKDICMQALPTSTALQCRIMC
jgi:ubiquitin-protein ligase